MVVGFFSYAEQAWPIMQKRCFPNDGNWNWIPDGDGVEQNEGEFSH